MRIAQQGRDINNWRYYLCIKRTTTITHQYIRFLTIALFPDKSEGLLRMYRQIRRQHLCTTFKCFSQSLRQYTLPTGIETVKKHDRLTFYQSFIHRCYSSNKKKGNLTAEIPQGCPDGLEPSTFRTTI